MGPQPKQLRARAERDDAGAGSAAGQRVPRRERGAPNRRSRPGALRGRGPGAAGYLRTLPPLPGRRRASCRPAPRNPRSRRTRAPPHAPAPPRSPRPRGGRAPRPPASSLGAPPPPACPAPAPAPAGATRRRPAPAVPRCPGPRPAARLPAHLAQRRPRSPRTRAHPRTPRTPRPQEGPAPPPASSRGPARSGARSRGGLPALRDLRPAMAPLGYFMFLYGLKQALGSYPIWW